MLRLKKLKGNNKVESYEDEHPVTLDTVTKDMYMEKTNFTELATTDEVGLTDNIQHSRCTTHIFYFNSSY